MFASLVMLVLAGTVPVETILDERVDLVELNHFYDQAGRLVFDQVIFYEWSAAAERHQVIDWRLVKESSQLPCRAYHGRACYSRPEYISTWQDGEVLRRVRAAAYRETWTQHDPELTEREHLPKDCRRKLRPLKRDAAKRLEPQINADER